MSTRKFLIAVDMQNDFISGALGSKEAQAMCRLRLPASRNAKKRATRL